MVGVCGGDLDVLDPGESIGQVELVKGLPIGGPIEPEFLGHVYAGHITRAKAQCRAFSAGNVAEGGPLLSSVRRPVDLVLGDVDPIRIEPAHRPRGQPGALRIDAASDVAGNFHKGIAPVVRPEDLSVIQRGIDDVLDLTVKGAVESITAEDVFPLTIVFEEGAVILSAGNQPVHGERVHVDAVGLGNGEPCAVVHRLIGFGVQGEGAPVISDEQTSIRKEGHTVLVGMDVGEVSACIPMGSTGPLGPAVFRCPQVHASGKQDVRVCRIDR